MSKLKEFLAGLSDAVDGFDKLQSAFGRLNQTVQKSSKGRVATTAAGYPMAPNNSGALVSREYQVKTIEERLSYIITMIRKGRDDPSVRKFAVQAVSKRCGSDWCTKEGDNDAEVRAVFEELRKKYRYVRDTYGKDLFQHPARTLEFGGGDCFPEGTLVLRDDYQLVPIEYLTVGQKIWGLDRWSEVQGFVAKGTLPVHAAQLNNGAWLVLTADHAVTVAHCERHKNRNREETTTSPCSCPVKERELVKIAFSELRPDMVVVSPERLPYGKEEQDPKRALIEGLYLADGWCSHPADFAIAGKDGHPKEAQKQRIEEICKDLGISTRMHARYITVKDKTWAERMHLMGTKSTRKKALSIDLGESAALALLEGVLADAGKNTHGNGCTFTTTSYDLALQVRVLCKMAGINCGQQYITNHGGEGKNPIHRLTLRSKHAKAEKLLRVRSVQGEVGELECFDIRTDDHYVYLPEGDVTVNQCDDATLLICSTLGSIGYPTKCRVIRTKNANDWNHIYALVGLPPKQPTRWVPLDLSVSHKPPGWEPPADMIAAVRDFDVPL